MLLLGRSWNIRFVPVVYPVLFVFSQGFYIGGVVGIGYVPDGGFEKVLQFLVFEDVSSVGKGQVPENTALFLCEEVVIIVGIFHSDEKTRIDIQVLFLVLIHLFLSIERVDTVQ